jgi:3-oxosteroid 1-dehydrogenase
MYGGTHGQGPGPGENPRKWLESGAVVKADTTAELAGKIGVDADGLARTVERSTDSRVR